MKPRGLLYIFGGILSLISIGVAFGKPISLSSMLFRLRASDLSNLSVTFSRSASTNPTGYNNTDYVLTSRLSQSGLAVNGTLSNGVAITSGQDVVRFYGSSSNLVFSIPSNSAGVTNFKKIKRLSFTYNGSYNVGNNYFNVIFSSDAEFVSKETINVENDTVVSTALSNAHYVKLVGNASHYAYFASITIHYSCSDEPDVKTLSSISISGQTTEFTQGDSFSFGGTVTAHYSDLTTADVTSSATFSGYDMSSSGDQTVTVSYTEGGVTRTTSYSITVNDASSGLTGTYVGIYTSIRFDTPTTGTYIYGNETLSFRYEISGTKITFTYVSGDNTNFGSYRLFAGGSSPKVNATGVINSDTSISVKTYNMFDSASSRTFTK